MRNVTKNFYVMVDNQLGFHCHCVIHIRNLVLLDTTQQELLLL